MRRIAIVILLLLPVAANAADKHPIDMTAVLTDLQDRPLPDPMQAAVISTKDGPQVDCSKCRPFTLGAAAANAICRDSEETKRQTTLEKAKNCALGIRIEHDPAAVLTTEQINLIESRIGIWGPMVAARAVPLLDPNIDLAK